MASFNHSLNPSTSSAENVAALFSAFVSNVENETRVLKSITNIRNHVLQTHNGSAVVEKLTDIESIISRLEKSIDQLDENIDQEMLHLCETKNNILAQTKAQAEETMAVKQHVSNYSQSSLPQKGSDDSNTGCLISDSEFDCISKSTRGRLTAQQVIDALQVLIKFAGIKTKVRSLKRKFLYITALFSILMKTIQSDLASRCSVSQELK